MTRRVEEVLENEKGIWDQQNGYKCIIVGLLSIH